MDQQGSSGTKTMFVVTIGVLLAVVLPVFIYLQYIAPSLKGGAELGTSGWFLFSYVMGLTMIVLPCTLPLAFVIVPLSMGKGLGKGIGMALSFGLGVMLMLSTYGALAAFVGKVGLENMGVQVGDIKNWVYFFAGIFAYTFALSEIGLLNFHMPSYTGSAPDFIQQRKDYVKAFLLGMFLGNVGVGCPHPATPLILVEIASSADIFYGWTLFLVHAFGRVVPLLILAVLAALGVNGLTWLVARKEKIERANGWAMVFVAGFILTLGLFSHDWWVNSGQHNLLEKFTQEEAFTTSINSQLGTATLHEHGIQTGTGIFGQPLPWGNWFIVFLWILPFFWYYRKEKKRVLGTPALQLQKLQHRLDRVELERRGIEVVLHIPEGEQGARVKELETQIDAMEKERRVLEEGMRYGAESGLRDETSQRYEEEVLHLRKNWYLTLSILLIAVFAIFLPFWFMNFEGVKSHGGEHATAPLKVGDAIKAIDAGAKVTPSGTPMPVIDESMPHAH